MYYRYYEVVHFANLQNCLNSDFRLFVFRAEPIRSFRSIPLIECARKEGDILIARAGSTYSLRR